MAYGDDALTNGATQLGLNKYLIFNGLGSTEVLGKCENYIALCWQVPQVQTVVSVLTFDHVLESLEIHFDIKRVELASYNT